MSTNALKDYWAKVRAGQLPAPTRQKAAALTRKLAKELDGSFGSDKGKRLVVTLHPDGRLEIRPERSRRSETVMLDDVYRFAIQCRVNAGKREKAAKKRANRMAILDRLARERAEKRLLRPD